MGYSHVFGKYCNFGDKEIIKAQVECAVKLVSPGGKIYFRCNPGITHDNKHAKWIDFFLDKEILEEFATEFACEINEISTNPMTEK